MKNLIVFITLSMVLVGCSDRIADLPSKGTWIDINRMPYYGPCYLIDGKLYIVDVIMRETYDVSSVLDSIKEEVPPINTADIDLQTFKFLLTFDKELFYAKDKNKVYYPVICCLESEYITCIDTYADFLYALKNADPQTFKYLGKGYAVDKNNMYYNGSRIQWNDSILDRFRVETK